MGSRIGSVRLTCQFRLIILSPRLTSECKLLKKTTAGCLFDLTIDCFPFYTFRKIQITFFRNLLRRYSADVTLCDKEFVTPVVISGSLQIDRACKKICNNSSLIVKNTANYNESFHFYNTTTKKQYHCQGLYQKQTGSKHSWIAYFPSR